MNFIIIKLYVFNETIITKKINFVIKTFGDEKIITRLIGKGALLKVCNNNSNVSLPNIY